VYRSASQHFSCAETHYIFDRLEHASVALFGGSEAHHLLATALSIGVIRSQEFFYPIAGGGGWVKARSPGSAGGVRVGWGSAERGREGARFASRVAGRLRERGVVLPAKALEAVGAGLEKLEGEGGGGGGGGGEGLDAWNADRDKGLILDMENVALGSAEATTLRPELLGLVAAVNLEGMGTPSSNGVLVGAGVDMAETVSLILQGLGVWKEADNLHLRRTMLVLEHPDEVLEAARHVKNQADR
jgi:hypothetical protein